MHPLEFEARYSQGGRYVLRHDRDPNGDHEFTIRDRASDAHLRMRVRPMEDTRYVIEEAMDKLKRDSYHYDRYEYRGLGEQTTCKPKEKKVKSKPKRNLDKLLLLTN